MIEVPGVIVEIEKKIGKHKHNHGKRIEEVWVISAIERTPEKTFDVEIEETNTENIYIILSQYVKEGSIVHTVVEIIFSACKFLIWIIKRSIIQKTL
ncbi:hypothetical protein H312_02194 [Anncaliia algerae PRA339]|uniref:Uncharacterized protein n=1 Tax=Anncaliia algerae PRA339 TaxID=1288291 RepID=A0A059EZQ5_9MICR|nr:hypothetical protein H312_02194 [Anncaliia algerae PRA339]